MGDIINFGQKKAADDGSFYYLFFYKNSTYAMFMHEETNVIKYGKTSIEGAQAIVDQIEMEEAQMIFNDTYDVFFLDIEHVGLLRLIAFFQNDLGTFGMYSDDYDDHSTTYFFEVIDHEAFFISDELKQRRLEKWFDDHYVIR